MECLFLERVTCRLTSPISRCDTFDQSVHCQKSESYTQQFAGVSLKEIKDLQ